MSDLTNIINFLISIMSGFIVSLSATLLGQIIFSAFLVSIVFAISIKWFKGGVDK